MPLIDYQAAVSALCERYHPKCRKCGVLFDICGIVLNKKLVSLKDLWKEIKGDQFYEARYAERLVMQVPRATIKLGSGQQVFVTEKVGRREMYDSLLVCLKSNMKPSIYRTGSPPRQE